jgi:acyl-CoA thioesterase FadM
VQVGVSKVGDSSVTLIYEIYRPGERDPAATSKIVLVCIGAPGWKSTPIPEKVRAAFLKHKA